MGSKKSKALLVLDDGLIFEGDSFGCQGEAIGEVIFNTSLAGYQEILTDPSYKSQIVVMTCPEIGNVGVNQEDVESWRPFVEGFVVRNYNRIPSNFRAAWPLHLYLERNRIPALEGIDTRALTRHLRDKGSKMGIISTVDLDRKRLLRKVREAEPLVGRDLVKEVTCREPYSWEEGGWRLGEGYAHGSPLTATDLRPSAASSREPSAVSYAFKVIAYDFGIKRNILRNLVDSGCDVTVVPASTPASVVLSMRPDGVLLSNGPGDPEPVSYAIEAIRQLVGSVPLFGICLGHQLLGLALGGRTYKLKFGHHGGNQPVMDLGTGKVEITAQNHGFAVDTDSLKGKAELTHINLNDRTVEGFRMTKGSTFSIQYHPEASPGPHDARYLFGRFVEMMGKK